MNPQYEFKGEVKCADFIGRDKVTNQYGFSAEDVERIIEKLFAMLQAGGTILPVANQPGVLQIEHEGEMLRFHKDAAGHLANQKNERAYLLSLSIDKDYQRWATHFVPLAGKLTTPQIMDELPIAFTEFILPTGDGEGQTIQQKPLSDITEAMQTHGAFVILGEPGAGKTTTLQKLAYDHALGRLANHSGRIPLFVRLSQQGDQDPHAFLETEWERRVAMPFKDALRRGNILILADGINEFPREHINQQLKAWMLFEEQYRGSNQLIFTGREKDYDNQLNLPRVSVDPLAEGQVLEFLQKFSAEGLAELLNDPASRLGEMARNPLNLFVLVMVYLQDKKNLQLLSNRGRLFQKFTQTLLAHEQQWHPDDLGVDSKISLYAGLAYEMQQRGSGTTLGIEQARAALPARVFVKDAEVQIDPDAVLRFGRGASILDSGTYPDVRFYHHLLQEYFAARELLRRFEKGEDLSAFWKAPRTSAEMPPANVSEWDPLPEPPTTGWEVTTILACGLSKDPAKLISAVLAYNPALAGRCLDEAGISALSGATAETKRHVQQALLATLYDPAMHLRTRLQAGFILGRIGDPRFEPQTFNGAKVILPTLVNVPAGTYTIGSTDDDSDAFDNEKPQHTVDLPAFAIGKWSVTNAEFACFIEAGGYSNEQYWQGDLAKRWLAGEDVSGGQFSAWLNVWKQLKQMGDVRKTLEADGNFQPYEVDYYERIAGLSEEELKSELGSQLSTKSRIQPEYWKDRERNNPSQPVVGITWFEANAYCVWLSEVTGKIYRLPTEIEWEASARGGDAHKYPWGEEWDKEKANTLEGRVMKPSPVGAYAAAGAGGPFDAEDQAGNVWDWTSSLNLPYPYQTEQSEQVDSTDERIVRGGSWYNNDRVVRCASRSRGIPVDFSYTVGFRVVSPAL